jgi:hypothetical protein
MIHVFERFVQDDTDVRGDKWQTVTWNWSKPDQSSLYEARWHLKCDWRMPYCGLLLLPHPDDDTKNMEFAYDLPYAILEGYVPGILNKPSYFTDSLKAAVIDLPDEKILNLGKYVKLVLKKEKIIDTCECSVDGRLYLYRINELVIDRS